MTQVAVSPPTNDAKMLPMLGCSLQMSVHPMPNMCHFNFVHLVHQKHQKHVAF